MESVPEPTINTHVFYAERVGWERKRCEVSTSPEVEQQHLRLRTTSQKTSRSDVDTISSPELQSFSAFFTVTTITKAELMIISEVA